MPGTNSIFSEIRKDTRPEIFLCLLVLILTTLIVLLEDVTRFIRLYIEIKMLELKEMLEEFGWLLPKAP